MALALCLVVPGSAALAGGISGTVRDADTNAPLANIDLDLFDVSFKSVDGFGDTGDAFDDHTAADGTFLLDPLPAGEYYVRVDPSMAQGYVQQYHPGVFLASEAATVQVDEFGTATVDFYLHRGATISGRMVDSVSGDPVVDVDLDVYAWDESFVSTIGGRSDSNGEFEIGPFPPGDFYLRADTAVDAMYVPQYYAGSATLEGSSPIHVLDENNILNVDFSLVRGGNVAGRLSDAVTGAWLVNMDLDIFDTNGTLVTTVNGKSNQDGIFYMGTLPAGQYYLRADPKSSDPYLETWYGNVGDMESSTLVEVTPGVITSPLYIEVAPAGWICGKVQLSTGMPLVDIDMDVYSTEGVLLEEYNTRTDLNGYYKFGPMRPGNFIVRTDPRGVYPFRPLYSGDVALIGEADEITVASGLETDLDFVYLVPAVNRRNRDNHELVGASPNPFNPRTTISFRLAEPGNVRLTIHDVRGRVVAVLAQGEVQAGTHHVVWDGMTDDGIQSATGVHFMQLQTRNGVERRKLVLLK